MIIEYIRYVIAAERKESFLEAYTQAGKYLMVSSNCLGFELTQGSEEPQNFILRIKWDSLEGHLEGFRKSIEFKSFFQAIAPFYQDIQEMKHYDFTDLYWNRSGN